MDLLHFLGAILDKFQQKPFDYYPIHQTAWWSIKLHIVTKQTGSGTRLILDVKQQTHKLPNILYLWSQRQDKYVDKDWNKMHIQSYINKW